MFCFYRYTEWVRFNMDPDYTPDWSVQHGVELYDHQTDPQENRNQADNPKYKKKVEELSKILRAGWRNVPIEDYEYQPPVPTKKPAAAANQSHTIHSFSLQLTVTYALLFLIFH